MKELRSAVPKSLYPPQTVLKAAYAFIDICYIHIDETPDSWIISMSAKDSSADIDTLGREFENELLSQAVHLSVYDQTHAIRELLLARAMSSSMVLEEDLNEPIRHEEAGISDEELDDILVSWFDKNE